VIFKACISEAKAGLPLPQIYTSLAEPVLNLTAQKVHRPISIQYSDSGNKLLCHQQFNANDCEHVTSVQTVGQAIIRLLLAT
jgi:hypothetical protein